MNENKLAIITVSMQKETILDLFTSLEKQSDKNFKLFIIDISSNPTAFPTVSIDSKVTQTKNKGYANGVNIGIKQAKKEGFRKFCVINDDTFVKEDFVANSLQRFSENPGSVLGGLIYYAPGHEYHKDRYKPSDSGKVIWYAGGIVDWDNAFTLHRGVDEVNTGKYDRLQQTEFITGCLIEFDNDVLNQIGLWDESYFLYYEDADFCERAKKNGITLYFDPSIVIWHKVSQSTGGSGSNLHAKYQKKNRVKWGLKFAPWRTKAHLVLNYITKGR